MKGLLIVGHPYSDYKFIEHVLYQQGMGQAKPSRREELTPIDISQEVLSMHNIGNQNEINQVVTSNIWNGLALDLLLGNKDQPFWGWADPQAVFLLDYWRKIGSQLKFLLVYDTPEAICSSLFKNTLLTQAKLEQEVARWVGVYNELLHFYHHNQQHCLLVHVEQIKHNLSPFLESTVKLIGYEPVEKSVTDNMSANYDAAEKFLISHLLRDFSTIYESYEELQAVADIPLVNKQIVVKEKAVDVWNQQQKKEENYQAEIAAFDKQYTDLQQQKTKLIAQYDGKIKQLEEEIQVSQHKNKYLGVELNQEKNSLQQAVVENKAVQEQLSKYSEKNALLKKEQNQLAHQYKKECELSREKNEEAELLLLQLHQVQEELEQYFLQNQSLEEEVKSVKEKNTQLNRQLSQTQQALQQVKKDNQPPLYYGAADRIKRQLSYRLGSVMIQQYKSKSVWKWLMIPVVLIQERQAFHCDFKEWKKKNLPPISAYQDAHEAERVKQHLSYRLGYAMVKRTGSLLNWIKLPWRLRQEIIDFKKRRTENNL